LLRTLSLFPEGMPGKKTEFAGRVLFLQKNGTTGGFLDEDSGDLFLRTFSWKIIRKRIRRLKRTGFNRL
jgi:hypothetical protein